MLDRWNNTTQLTPADGKPDGLIDPASPEMTAAAAADPLIADFANRAQNFWATWFDALQNAQDDFFAVGCGW